MTKMLNKPTPPTFNAKPGDRVSACTNYNFPEKTQVKGVVTGSHPFSPNVTNTVDL